MEPLSAIGLAGSVVGTIDVVVRTLSALRRLQNRWKSANLIVAQLIGQHTTLRAVLDQISDWVSRRLEGVPRHQQLVIDLEASMESCKSLVSFMDDYTSVLEWNDSNTLSFESKARAVFQDSSVKEFQNCMTNQGVALNLLLTAMNS